MKKILPLLLILLLILTACGNNSQNTTLQGVQLPAPKDNQAIVVIQSVQGSTEEVTAYDTYLVDVDKLQDKTALSALIYLRDNHNVTIGYQDGQWGAYLTQVGELVATNNTYLILYTSIESQWDTSAYFVSYNCGGTTIGSSGRGVTSMSVEGGSIIYIQLETYA